MPPGEPSGPESVENVRDQFMRTLSAVRTRLRGPVTDPEDGNGNGEVPAVAEELPASPMDPLLADPPTNGRGDADVVAASAAPLTTEPGDATTIEAPPEYEHPAFSPPPATVEAPTVAVPGGAEPLVAPAAVGVPKARRKRVRPALPLLRRRPRVRKVTRIVRRVDAWGVFKISLVFYVILYIILLVAGLLLWNLANTTGTVANVEGFIRDLFGLKTFEFDGEKLFRASWVLGAVLVIAGTGVNVTLAVLFNLISDLVGGLRVTVLEEEVILRERPALPRPAGPPANVEPVSPPGPPADFPAPAYSVLARPEVVDVDAPPPTSV